MLHQAVDIKSIMRKVIFLLSALAQLTYLCQAQGPNLKWAKTFGSGSFTRTLSIKTDKPGNIYTTGIFSTQTDLDPGQGKHSLSAQGDEDVFIQKLDPDGNLIWGAGMGSKKEERSNEITIDKDGNVLTTGYFEDSTDFDPGPGVYMLDAINKLDIFIQKLDSNGNFIWAKRMGGFGVDIAKSITTDSSGNIFLAGEFTNTADFDPGPGSFNLTSTSLYKSGFIVKLNPMGDFIWAKALDGDFGINNIKIRTDQNGDALLTGSFWGEVDFDPGPGTFNITAAAHQDIFVLKLDKFGDMLWAKSMGGFSFDTGNALVVDPIGNVYSTGFFAGTIDFDPGPGTFYLQGDGLSNDVYVQKLNSNGDFVWAKQIFGQSDLTTYDIAIDQDNKLYTLGTFTDSADFDPGIGIYSLVSKGSTDFFVQKLDSAGNFIWAKSIGGGNEDAGRAITTDLKGNIITTGSFRDTVDFDPGVGIYNQIDNGYFTPFVTKWDQCNTITGTDTQTACDAYTWIDGNTYTSSNNTATFTINGGAANGCDSMVSLALTINTVSDISTTITGLTITANNNNSSYQWLDCNNNYSLINGATNQSFSPTTNGNYAVQLIENGCTDTSACVSINSVSISGLESGPAFSLYPNPTNGQFVIDFPNKLTGITLSISDLRGRVIYHDEYQHRDQIEISLSEPAGIYLIQVQTPKGVNTLKLIKK